MRHIYYFQILHREQNGEEFKIIFIFKNFGLD